MTIRIAAVQMDIALHDAEANVRRVIERIDRFGDGHHLMVFPECCTAGYGFDDRRTAVDAAWTLDDDRWAPVFRAAAVRDVAVTIGTLHRDGDRLYNAAMLIADGRIVGHYRKTHLPHLGVDRFVDRGDVGFPVFKVPGVDLRVGMGICYDSSFPEPMRALALAGADVIALGTNWPVAASRTAEVVPAARSMENHCYFVAANRVGSENGFEFCGRSSITGPDGVVLALCDDDSETVLSAEIDVEVARNKQIQRTPGKHVIDRFGDRRPELYEALVRRGEPPG